MSELGTTLRDRIENVRERYGPVRQIVKKAVSEGLQGPKAKPSDVRLLRRGAFLAAEEGHKKQMRLQEESLTDHKTDLPNDRFFDSQLEEFFTLARRHDRPLSLMYLDFDDFKGINDTYGHSAGDGVLKEIGQLLKKNLRREDFCARIGGDEFAVILPETKAEGLLEVAEKIRQVFAQTPLGTLGNISNGKKSLTVSIGCVVLFGQALPDELKRQADIALYHSKENGGKNKVTLFTEGMIMPQNISEITRPDL